MNLYVYNFHVHEKSLIIIFPSSLPVFAFVSRSPVQNRTINQPGCSTIIGVATRRRQGFDGNAAALSSKKGSVHSPWLFVDLCGSSEEFPLKHCPFFFGD